MQLYVIIEDEQRVELFNSVGDKLVAKRVYTQKKVEKYICKKTGKTVRYIFRKSQGCNVFIATFDLDVQDKLIQGGMTGVLALIPTFRDQSSEQQRKKDYQSFTKLKHNLSTQITKISQELQLAFPKVVGESNAIDQMTAIARDFQQDTKGVSKTLLRVMKFAKMVQTELHVFEILNSPSKVRLSVGNHKIYKVLVLAANPYWLDFMDKGVRISILPCNAFFEVDYATISVVFAHILDNAYKYTCPNTELVVEVKYKAGGYSIVFEMISLEFSENEVEELFVEGRSGEAAHQTGLAGSGLGLYVIDRLLHLNNGYLQMLPEVDPLETRIHEGLRYTKNQVVVHIAQE